VTEPLLRLYVAGNSATARRAEHQLLHLQTRIDPGWKVEVVDVIARPELAERAGIVGDLSDARRVLEFLGIELKGNGK
jgi:circadian clock protein KaiB